MGLKYTNQDPNGEAITGYVDADFGKDIDTRNLIAGLVFTMFGTSISWKANLQSAVTLSTTEAEYIAITEGVKEAIW